MSNDIKTWPATKTIVPVSVEEFKKRQPALLGAIRELSARSWPPARNRRCSIIRRTCCWAVPRIAPAIQGHPGVR